MTDALGILRRHMPPWMATRGAALLAALPDGVERWVQQTAQQVDEMKEPPEPKMWDSAIETRFGQGRSKPERAQIVDAMRTAVLLAAIQRLPPPPHVPGAEETVSSDTKTKELDRLGIKRSRVLGLIEIALQNYDAAAETLVASL